jgi:hypothetical protein
MTKLNMRQGLNQWKDSAKTKYNPTVHIFFNLGNQNTVSKIC